VPDIRLHTGDAAELGEMLQFLDEWLGCGGEQLRRSLSDFIGSDAYDIPELRRDLNRFAFLLGATDGEQLFGLTTHDRGLLHAR
jgi:hypothetical protein